MSLPLKSAVLIAITSGLLLGCATSQKIQVVQPGDHNLSCDAIKAEMAKLDKAEADIESKKGVTGTNVASALFGCRVWPIPIMTLARPHD